MATLATTCKLQHHTSEEHCEVLRRDGRRGLQGLQGPQGPPGATGAQGRQGSQGPSTVPTVEARMRDIEERIPFISWPPGQHTVTINPISTTDVAFDPDTSTFTILTTGVYRFSVMVVRQSGGTDNALLSVNVDGTSMFSISMMFVVNLSRMVASSLSLTAGNQVTFVSYLPDALHGTFRPVSYTTSGVNPYLEIYRVTVAYFYRVI